MSFGKPSLLVLVALAALSGCGSKESVSLTANVQNVSLTVTDATLGTELGGGFDLYLEVGPEASGGATVTLEAFALVAAADQATLVSPLDALPQGETFPLTVGKGQTKVVPFSLDTSKLLTAAEKAKICAGEVLVTGAVKHDLNGGETKPLSSSPVTPGGC